MFSLLERLIKLMGWMRIAASPIIIGLIVAAVVYLKMNAPFNLYFSVPIALSGFVIGILWANRIQQKKGTIEFLAKNLDMPELHREENKE